MRPARVMNMNENNMDDKKPKLLVVDDNRSQSAALIARLLTQRDTLEAIPESDRTLIQKSDLFLVKTALKAAKRHGALKQGPSSQPRPKFIIGEPVKAGEITYWVGKVKADGRLRLIWSGTHHPVGVFVAIGEVAYIVTAVGPRQILLRQVTAEDIQAEKAKIDKQIQSWANPDADQKLSAELGTVDAVTKSAPGEYRSMERVFFMESEYIPAKKTRELSYSQERRRLRKANRAQGILERKRRQS